MSRDRAPAGRGVPHSCFALIAAFTLTALLCAAPASADDLQAQFSRWSGLSKPLFTLDNLRNAPVSLADLRSDVVIVHFFATWCEPCREELPALDRLSARSDPARLRIVTISVAEVDVRVRSFVEKVPLNLLILLDRDRAVARSWQVSALPTTFILDRDLRPRLFIERDHDWDSFDGARALKAFAD